MKNLLYIVLILFCFLAGNSVSAKEFRFVQVTDVHYNFSPQSDKILDKTINQINSLNKVNFVVFTGDNIDVSDEAALKAFLKKISKLKMSYYIVLGNHDVFKANGLSKEEYMETVRKYSHYKHPKKSNYVFEKGNIIFVVLDGTKEIIPGTSGYYKDVVLNWLDKTLTKYQDKKVIIFQHFPIITNEKTPNHNTCNSDLYRKVLSNHDNVIAIFSGHYHENTEEMIDNVYHVATSPCLGNNPVIKVVDIDIKVNQIKRKEEYAIYTHLMEIDAN